MIYIAAKIAIPCFLSLILRPNVKHNPAGINNKAVHSIIFVSELGFSNGCAEFTPKNPPPFVPNCLIAIWLAPGPIGTNCFVTIVASATFSSSTNTTLLFLSIVAFSIIFPLLSTAIGSTNCTACPGDKFCTTP